jgi:hypothetical protein
LIDADGEGALAFGQDRGQVSGISLYELILVDGFIGDEGFPDDGSNGLGKPVRCFLPHNHVLAEPIRGPREPFELALTELGSQAQIGCRDEDFGRRDYLSLDYRARRRNGFTPARQIGRRQSGYERDGDDGHASFHSSDPTGNRIPAGATAGIALLHGERGSARNILREPMPQQRRDIVFQLHAIYSLKDR